MYTRYAIQIGLSLYKHAIKPGRYRIVRHRLSYKVCINVTEDEMHPFSPLYEK